ncbi:hypothetical protein DU500_01160 [Haloplanus rubicundus]|uniref:Uncharacterized protein n=1 Tax=Haloplanus rubicundus TaxID=1547898 RepID=A0A345DYX2_9EURY|nr:hypothetical protein [Haloplanus rubicundus]AXG05144.1 hypothetical protein DU500_01160 [Haloplanus rubicundus]AXG11616.1 hypothetical protein DU484_18120 [Haloplanus rubicundus]
MLHVHHGTGVSRYSSTVSQKLAAIIRTVDDVRGGSDDGRKGGREWWCLCGLFRVPRHPLSHRISTP